MSFELETRVRTLEAEVRAQEVVFRALINLLAFRDPTNITIMRGALPQIAASNMPRSGENEADAFALSNLVARIERTITPTDE